jgi:hypothetical protein
VIQQREGVGRQLLAGIGLRIVEFLALAVPRWSSAITRIPRRSKAPYQPVLRQPSLRFEAKPWISRMVRPPPPQGRCRRRRW